MFRQDHWSGFFRDFMHGRENFCNQCHEYTIARQARLYFSEQGHLPCHSGPVDKGTDRFQLLYQHGGMLDVDFADLINFLGNDDSVSSIAFYLHKLTNFRKFMSAARAVSRIKPIIALKSGRAGGGGLFETSQKPAIIGEDDIYGAAFKRAGIERVNTFAELFDCAELLARQTASFRLQACDPHQWTGARHDGRRCPCRSWIELPSLNSEVIGSLSAILPPSWTGQNPVDVGADASPQRYAKVVEICLAAPEIKALLIILVPNAAAPAAAVAESLLEILRGRRISVYTVWLGAAEAERGREILNRSDLPTFGNP